MTSDFNEFRSQGDAVSMAAHRHEPYLLAATLEIQEPSFRRTVILVAEHTKAGALGFVINRPGPQSLAQLFPTATNCAGDPLQIPPQIPVWQGGPVPIQQGLILQSDGGADGFRPRIGPGDTPLAPGVTLVSVENGLERLVAMESVRLEVWEELRATGHADNMSRGQRLPGFDQLYPYRFLLGYAGWGPMQLDREIKEGAWLQIALDRELLFNTPWNEVWDRAMADLGLTAEAIQPQSPGKWLN